MGKIPSSAFSTDEAMHSVHSYILVKMVIGMLGNVGEMDDHFDTYLVNTAEGLANRECVRQLFGHIKSKKWELLSRR